MERPALIPDAKHEACQIAESVCFQWVGENRVRAWISPATDCYQLLGNAASVEDAPKSIAQQGVLAAQRRKA